MPAYRARLAALVPFRAKAWIKEHVARGLRIPFPRNGLPHSLVRYLVNAGPLTVVDVGAHEGAFMDAIRQICGVRKGLLCEPIQARAEALRTRFRPPQYGVFEGAVTARSGIVQLELQSFDATSSLLRMRNEIEELGGLQTRAVETRAVQARTLDQLVQEYPIDGIDLLKIDVQGGELGVLQGAERAIQGTRMIWIETSFKELYEGSALFSDVHSFLSQRHFRLLEIEPGFRSPKGELLQADLLFAKDDHARATPLP